MLAGLLGSLSIDGCNTLSSNPPKNEPKCNTLSSGQGKNNSEQGKQIVNRLGVEAMPVEQIKCIRREGVEARVGEICAGSR